MTRLQKMVLKPKEQLVTRLFLSPKLQQNLTVLSYSTYDLVSAMKELSESNPFVSLAEPKSETHSLEWIGDTESESLPDHLLLQVRMSDWSNKEKSAVKLLIYNLDDDGYLRAKLNELAQASEFSLADLEQAKVLLQSLDPYGVGASSLNECLLIQARQKENFDETAMQILLSDSLELLADPQKWEQSDFSASQLTQALANIQTLDPTPASEYVTEQNVQYLLPDLIFKVEDGRLTIETAKSQIPEILFDEKTYKELKTQSNQGKYFSQQRQDYLEMKNAIDQRQQTILRLGKYAGEYQRAFLTTMQTQELKPLGLKDAANALNLAPSTISRAIKDKYIQCQNKIFSLKILFPRKVTTDLSQARIEYDLQKLIDQESPQQPLSDQQLVEHFADHGVTLSRRVIAKYRKKLNIPNSYQRKRD